MYYMVGHSSEWLIYNTILLYYYFRLAISCLPGLVEAALYMNSVCSFVNILVVMYENWEIYNKTMMDRECYSL